MSRLRWGMKIGFLPNGQTNTFPEETHRERQQKDIHETLGKIVSMMAAEDLDAAPILVPGESVTPGPDKKP